MAWRAEDSVLRHAWYVRIEVYSLRCGTRILEYNGFFLLCYGQRKKKERKKTGNREDPSTSRDDRVTPGPPCRAG